MQKIKTLPLLAFFFFTLLSFLYSPNQTYAVNERTRCSGNIIDLKSLAAFANFEKKILSFHPLSRPGTCGVKPTKIVMHTTWGIVGADDLWGYFENHPEGRYASTQFVVGGDGKVMQMLETLDGKAEIGWAVSYFNDDSVSIELGRNGNFNSKSEVPQRQYEEAVKLVQALMKAYNIPVGNIEYANINNRNNPASGGPISKSSLGIFGHYQLSPDDRSDPGQGFLRDFRADMKLRGPATGSVGTTSNETASESSTFASSSCTQGADGTITCPSNCVITNVGQPTGEAQLPSHCPTTETGSTGSTGGSTPGGGGQPGQPLPSQNITQIKQVLCSQYKVCPTETSAWDSANGWTLPQLTALWNIVQRIYESPTYKAHAIGNHVLEITRAASYPGNPGWVWGYHANGTNPAYHTIPGSRLIIVTDKTNEAGSQGILEWFFAHEIAHSASWGSASGGWPNGLGNNPAYQGVMACGEVVSSYGSGSRDENFADTVSYYMTHGEEVTSYRGASKNLKLDHPCSYNALKTHFFNGKEF